MKLARIKQTLCKQNTTKTRLNMLFIPTLPVKAEFTAMLRILSNAENAEQCRECWAMLSILRNDGKAENF